MSNTRALTVAAVLSSPLLMRGLTSVLSSLSNLSVTLLDFQGVDLDLEIHNRKPSVLVVDPLYFPAERVEQLRAHSSVALRVVALATTLLPTDHSGVFDACISVYDSEDALAELFTSLAASLTNASGAADADNSPELSPREKDVVIAVVKGMSNKEIAAEMNVSVHTVMTHRRNIASKLQIHSAAGLAIYAIVRKLVRLDQVNPNAQ
jgi:DNA-binding NarL/FixJ family response regulator